MYETECTPAEPPALARAAGLLRAGQVVALPTETVYGLAADATNPEALQRIYDAKRRPMNNPLIVHVGRALGDVEALVRAGYIEGSVLTTAQHQVTGRLIKAFWPGPLSLVLPRGQGVAAQVSAGSDTVGLRMPDHEAFLELLRLTGLPLAAPSANRSNRISPTSAAHVVSELGGRIPMVIDAGATRVGVESTVVRVLVDGAVELLRPGGVPRAALERVAGSPVNTPSGTAADTQSPGRRAVHYAPDKTLVLSRVDEDPGPALGSLPAPPARLGVLWFARQDQAGCTELPTAWARALDGVELEAEVIADPGDGSGAASRLFAALRALDASRCDALLAELPADSAGMWPAITDRLLRAAAGRRN